MTAVPRAGSALWGNRHVTVRSPLAVAAAVAALDRDRATALTTLGLSTRGAAYRRVTGRVSADAVRLEVRTGCSRSPTVLYGRILERPEGSELRGGFLPPLGALFAAALLTVLGVALLLAALVDRAYPLLAAGAVFTAAGGLTGWATARSQRRGEDHLRRWVARRLE